MRQKVRHKFQFANKAGTRKGLGLAISLLGIFLLVATSSGVAGGATTEELGFESLHVAEEDMASIEGMARSFGISLEDAAFQYGWHDEFSLMTSALQEQFPDSYAAGRVDGERSARVSFKGEVPRGAQDLIDDFTEEVGGIRLDVRTVVGFSEAEMEAAVVAAHMRVFEASDRELTTYYDDLANEIVFEIAALPHRGGAVASAMQASAREQLDRQIAEAVQASFSAPLLEAAELRITHSALTVLGGAEGPNHHNGGEALRTCTSGFGTRATSHTSGTRGVLTAAHCSNSQTDDGHTLTFKGAHLGSNGDVQWHTGPKVETDNFYQGNANSTEANLQDVNAVANPAGGAAVCRNGKTTDQHCDTVMNAHICSSGICSLVRTHNHTSAGGDSGGPYFSGRTAYGVHRGFMTDGAWPYQRRGVFTRALSIDEALGVYIATS